MPIASSHSTPRPCERIEPGQDQRRFEDGESEGLPNSSLRQMEVGMRPKVLLAVIGAAASLLLVLGRASVAQGPALDTAAIEQATGLKGTMIAEESVFKVSKPRADV